MLIIMISLNLTFSPLLQLIEKHGTEAEKHLFRCLLSQVDFSSADGRNSSSKDGQQLFLLTAEANSITSRPSFVSVLCYGFENQENKVYLASMLVYTPAKPSFVLFLPLFSLLSFLHHSHPLFLPPSLLSLPVGSFYSPPFLSPFLTPSPLLTPFLTPFSLLTPFPPSSLPSSSLHLSSRPSSSLPLSSHPSFPPPSLPRPFPSPQALPHPFLTPFPLLTPSSCPSLTPSFLPFLLPFPSLT